MDARRLLASIVSGQTITGAITSTSQQDSYTFTAAAAESFVVASGPAGNSTLETRLQIYGPDGTRLINDNYNGYINRQDSYRVPDGAGGTFTALVYGGGTGTYAVEMIKSNTALAASGDGRSITSGQTIAATIDHPGDIDGYTFSAVPGESFVVATGPTGSSDVETRLQVYAPDGTQLFNDNYNGYINRQDNYLVPAGKGELYTVVAFGGGVGAYAIEVIKSNSTLAAGGDGKTIASGQMIAAIIDHPGDIDGYTFSGVAGQSFVVATGPTGSSNLETRLQIYAPDGTQLFNENYNGYITRQVRYLIPTGGDGIYTAVVFGGGTGQYAIEMIASNSKLASGGDGQSITSGQVVNATIDHPGDIDGYTFTASDGDTFTVATKPTTSSQVETRIQVFAPDGTRVIDDQANGYVARSRKYQVPSAGKGVYTVVASGGGTGDYTLSLGGVPLLASAALSQDVYRDAPVGYLTGQLAGYAPLATDRDPTNRGYFAEAYTDAFSNQIVVAFRGTVFSEKALRATLKTLSEDTSFLTSTPSQFLASAVADAARFVAALHNAFPDSAISITGHSLGGAVAQLIGWASRVETRVFNAPGAGALCNRLTIQLAPANGIGADGTNVDYRLYGDQVSLAGTAIGTQITLADPIGTTFVNYPTPILHVVGNLQAYLKVHSIDTVIDQVRDYYQIVSPTGEPNDTVVLENAIPPKSVFMALTPGDSVLNFAFPVSSATYLAGVLIDPPAGSDFTLTGDGASPAITSVTLPSLGGVSGYSVRYKIGATWSAYQNVAAGTTYTLGQASRTVEFLPLDAAGINVATSDEFFLDATFSSAGTFMGTLGSGTTALPTWLSLGTGAVASLTNSTLSLLEGAATFTADAGMTNPGLGVTVGYAAGVSFATTQHLGALKLNDAATATIAAGQGKVLAVTGLSVAPAARLDLADNALIYDYTGASPAAAVRSLIGSARNGGTWTGLGLTSTSARTNTAGTTALGYLEASDYKSINGLAATFAGEAIDDTAVLVRYTLYGDTDLDRGVSINDFNRLSTNFGGAAGKTWLSGDFDYDGGVSINDFNLLSTNFGKTLPAAAPLPAVKRGVAPAKH